MVTFHKTSDTLKTGSITLPQKYYTSDEVFEREQERIFNGYWICAGHQIASRTRAIISCSISLARALSSCGIEKTSSAPFTTSAVIVAHGFAKPPKENSRIVSNALITPGPMAWMAS